jgi:hypothetical protein
MKVNQQMQFQNRHVVYIFHSLSVWYNLFNDFYFETACETSWTTWRDAEDHSLINTKKYNVNVLCWKINTIIILK